MATLMLSFKILTESTYAPTQAGVFLPPKVQHTMAKKSAQFLVGLKTPAQISYIFSCKPTLLCVQLKEVV